MPHVNKQKVITKYAKQYHPAYLVETGTFMGDMVAAQLPFFEKLISIEITPHYYQKCVERFKGEPKVQIIHGDSGTVLRQLISEIKEPILFWLDGHWSGGDTGLGEKQSPIIEEIEAIFKSTVPNPIIIIDDYRLFVGDGEYPDFYELKRMVKKLNPSYSVEVEQDVITLLPTQIN